MGRKATPVLTPKKDQPDLREVSKSGTRPPRRTFYLLRKPHSRARDSSGQQCAKIDGVKMKNNPPAMKKQGRVT